MTVEELRLCLAFTDYVVSYWQKNKTTTHKHGLPVNEIEERCALVELIRNVIMYDLQDRQEHECALNHDNTIEEKGL